jgi:hypothetical protein
MTITNESKQLFEATLRELFQAERSGSRHPRVEAQRLGESAPAAAMDDIANHACAALEQLDDMARERGVNPAEEAKVIGRALSTFRNQLADLTLTSEQSFRMTMLGVRHGIDLVRLLRELAVLAQDDELRRWSEGWLLRRIELVEQAEAALEWFAANPRAAIAPARSTPLAIVARTVAKAFGKGDMPAAARHV